MEKSNINKTLRVVLLLVIAMLILFILSHFISLFENNVETETINPTIDQNLTEINSSAQQEIIGNPIDINLKTGMNVIFIENSAQKVSIRFTPQFSGEVIELVIKGRASDGHAVRVGLQEDKNGTPEGGWMSENGFGISQINNSNFEFITVKLQNPVPVLEGKVYHIVIEPIDLTDKILIMTYLANAFAQPLNNENPDIIWQDPYMNMFFYNGKVWREENKWPIFAIGYSDGRLEGQPYSLAAPWVIHDSVYVGQAIVPVSEYSIGKVALVVSLKGSPKDRLYYEIIDSNNSVMAKGLFAESSQLTTWKTWIEVSLDSPVMLKDGELYRIILFSPGTDLDNAYRVYGHEFGYNSSIGYGGLRHYLTISHNAGSKWAKWEDADTIFKLTTAK